jgi:hypothetical protein
MQHPFSVMPTVLAAIEATISAARLERYLPISGDRQLALRTYTWNARLCEQFILPVQLAEICVRNALNRALVSKFGVNWFSNASLFSPLPDRLKNEISQAVKSERNQHGDAFSVNHMVSALSFGFWVHLTTKSAIRLIWGGKLPALFAHLPGGTADQQVFEKIDQLRKFRNRLAHHNAIFDKRPAAEYRNIQDIIGWACPDTLWFMRQLVNPAAVINQRPTF